MNSNSLKMTDGFPVGKQLYDKRHPLWEKEVRLIGRIWI